MDCRMVSISLLGLFDVTVENGYDGFERLVMPRIELGIKIDANE